MMISLRGLGAFQVEPYVQAVAAAMREMGYNATVTDPEGPSVQVCMREGSEPQLCTRLEESGTPWSIYSPSNIANIQAGRYEDIYGDSKSAGSSAASRSMSAIPVSFSFSNDTTGNRSVLKVGDRWTLTVTGPPNSEVVMVGGPSGAIDRTVMGRTNASGVWSASGSPSVAELGNWNQQILVGGRSAGNLVFQVVEAPERQTEKKSASELLEEQAAKEEAPNWMSSLTSNPWLLIGGAAVLFFVMGRSK